MKLIAGEHRTELAREKMFQVGNNKSNTRWTCVIKSTEKFLNGLTRGIERYISHVELSFLINFYLPLSRL